MPSRFGNAFAAISVFAVIASFVVPSTMWAQTPPHAPQDKKEGISVEPGPGDTVTSRARPDYDPLGVRVGGFFLYPELSLTETYHDNIFFTDSGKESDFITTVSPEIRLKSNWNVHSLNAFATADIARFADNSSENTNDWRTGFDGRFDIDRSMNLSGGFKYESLHEDRSSPDQAGASEPVAFSRTGPRAFLTKRFNRLSVRAGGELVAYDYDDAQSGLGATLNMDDRDRLETRGTVRFGYKIASRYEAFVRSEYNNRNYDAGLDDNGVDRDSNGWETVAGLAIDFGGVTFGNVFVGYLRQDFDDPALSDISGLSFGGDLTWNPTRLTTVKLAASRSVEDTTLSGAAGALSSRVGLRADHELLRNLVLSAEAEYRNNDYEGIDRDDDIGRFGLGANYLMNRFIKLQLRAAHVRRESNVADGDYDANTVLFRIIGQY